MLQRAGLFAEALRGLLGLDEAAEVEARWRSARVEARGWEVLRQARRETHPGWVPVLDEIDGLLLRLLDRVPLIVGRGTRVARHIATFRVPALERLQHATAAALVAHRYGAAGLATVVGDAAAPLPRRYYAFLALAAQHPPAQWPLFDRYLNPAAHHAFVGAAAEAARYYPRAGAADVLMNLFGGVRSDLHLRAFLSPRILESLFVLADPGTLPFIRDLLVTGHTAPDPELCEVTRALVMVRRITGRLEPNTKFADLTDGKVRAVLDRAEAAFERHRHELSPVVVI